MERLFDWVAAHAVHRARGTTSRLFAMVFGVGIVVTTFLSNDATAVLLASAVYAAAKTVKAELPMLFACALIVNAASFVLPISNPANLVLYGGEMPPLGAWMASFALPSVMVEALASTGVITLLAGWLAAGTRQLPAITDGVAGTILAFGSNLINNLPAGSIAHTALPQAEVPKIVTDGLLIGVDLGPNLSIPGSLATMLWLTAIRREGEDIGFWRLLKVGMVTMPPALAAALNVRLLLC